ncbi:MAG: GNAT family N-acetyltransferase [Pseudonocardiales bacterium]|nr:GNAT family N-acetyltransferase [Pseudonocardiales bacterium]
MSRRAAGVGTDCGEGTTSIIACPDPDPNVLRAWDRLVNSTAGSDVTQLTAWARLRGRVGYESLYLLAFQAKELVGGAQIMYRRVPGLGAVGYLPYGPVISPGAADRLGICRAFGSGLATVGRCRLRMLFVQPPEGADDLSCELLRRGFRTSTASIAPAGSIRIDLTATEEEIRRRFARRLRSWPKKWVARGVTVRLGDGHDVALLATLMAHSARHQDYQPLQVDYLRAMYSELAATGQAALFVGEVHGEPVAADLVTACGAMVRGRLAGFDRTGEAGRLSVPAAIRWEIIRWAKARGYRWYDLGGLHEQTLRELLSGECRYSDSWASSDQAKAAFGGSPYRYPSAVEMINPAPVRIAYDLSRRWPGGRRLVARATRRFRGSSL